MKKNQGVDRRSFIKGMGVVGVASAGVLVGCVPEKQIANASNASVDWDQEADLVVIGSGTGVFGALMAKREGASVVVVEKGANLGGTTALSGNGCWVPKNRHMAKHGIQELPDEQIIDYIDACDVFKSAPRSLKENYVKRASKVFDYIEDEFGFHLDTNYEDPKFAGKAVRGDYYPLPGNMPLGRSLFFCNEAGEFFFSKNYAESVLPYAKSVGLDMMFNSKAQKLITDAAGSVLGVEVKTSQAKSLKIKANKGVVLSAGGFDHDKAMVKEYLRDRLYGTNAVAENTGDAHKMGMAVGAALGNMASSWGVPFIKNIAGDEYSTAFDWSSWRTKPYSLIVNKKGRRFASESSAYSIINLAFAAYDAGQCAYLNMPAYLICDSRYVANYGYPGQKKEKDSTPSLPDYVGEFASIEEIAAKFGIDEIALQDEVERFNSYAKAGVDPDWKRGEYFHEYRTNGDMRAAEKGLANACMGPVEVGPFYVAEIGPGTCGTSGGLVVDAESCVLRPDGTIIGGLYAAGNTAASIFGSGYPGAGATLAPGIFQSMVAANHALGLSKF